MFAWLWLVVAGPSWATPEAEGYGDHLARAILAQESELLAIVSRDDPFTYRRLLRLRETDRAAYIAGLYRVANVVDRMARDPAFATRWREILQKQAELTALAAGYAALPPAEQAARRARLVAAATELFELRQEDRRERIAELTARLHEIQAELDERAGDREGVIEAYVDQLVRPGSTPPTGP